MRLLQIEFKKLKGNKSFWIFSLLFIIFLPLLVVLLPGLLSDKMEGFDITPKTAQATWYFAALVSSYFSMFILAFILIYHIANEYTYRTARQNVIDGLSRWEFALGKIQLLTILSILATAYVFLVGLIGIWYFGGLDHSATPSFNPMQMMQGMMGGMGKSEPIVFGDTFEGVISVFGFFIQILGYFSFATFISFLVKRGALAVLLFFVAFLVEWIGGTQLASIKMGFVYEYMPLNSMSKILPNPGFMEILQGTKMPQEVTLINTVIILVWVTIFLFFTQLIFKKRDIS